MNITMHDISVFVLLNQFWIILRYGIIGSKNINILKLMCYVLPTFFPKMILDFL